MLTDEYRYKILKELQKDPDVSQRELAKRLKISLGRANFCLKALVEKGLVKVESFRNNANKASYLYLLTPKGVEDSAILTRHFLRKKLQEYESLTKEIEELRREILTRSSKSD